MAITIKVGYSLQSKESYGTITMKIKIKLNTFCTKNNLKVSSGYLGKNMSISTKQRPNFCSPSLAIVTSPFE